MAYNLVAMARRANPGMRRKSILLRDIVPPSTLATDLYRATYARVISAWNAALPAINDAYARSLSELTTDAPADVRAEIEGAAEQINRLILLLTPQIREWALSVEKWQRGKWRGAVLSATGVDLETMLGPADVRASLETSIEWNTSLIKDVSDVTRQKIGNAVFDSLRNRTPAREVAKTISDSVGMSRKRSTRIASDQLNKLTSSLAEERRREAGLSDWEWVHSQKAHPRAQHVARNGNYYTDDPSRVGKVLNGKTLLAPPPDRCGQEPYCGCRPRAIISFDD